MSKTVSSQAPCVYVVGGDISVIEMFQNAGWQDVSEIGTSEASVSLVCFTGGADVSPELYGEKNEGLSHTNPKRDKREKEIYDTYLSLGTPMVGICRGGQFLNVMNGGSLIQHLGRTVSGYVKCMDTDGDYYKVHVDHHQGIVRNPETSWSILAYDAGNIHPHGPGVGVTYACYYPETKSLCFQPHPEWGHEPTKDLFFKLIKEYIG